MRRSSLVKSNIKPPQFEIHNEDLILDIWLTDEASFEIRFRKGEIEILKKQSESLLMITLEFFFECVWLILKNAKIIQKG